MVTAAWVCLLSPLAGALLVTLLGTRVSRRVSAYVSTLSCGVAAVAAIVAFFALTDRDEEGKRELSVAYTWLSAGDLKFELSILVDPLSVLMLLVVAGVGSLIVAYSIGYMDGDDEERRYFAYMALFVFSMLTLVLAGNYLILLAGWGLVGLCSYLLIGFHHERPSAIQAAKKAFVMNAFGDATMALALFMLIWSIGTLDYLQSFEAVGELSDTTATLVALGLLGGAVAKSAQIPLQTWLPDAMEGPTPVSALIHAATMVTAGVYLIARLHPIFEEAEFVQNLAAGLGAVTLLAAGLIALVQVDIKRVIAYSTMSQIGYMFVGVGVGAYASGMFHLMTHAFFKALLFLGAGVIIHALAGEQDIRRMGGLKELMPGTWIAMLIGGLALAGIPPMSGFFSKDAILASTLARGDWWGYLLFAAGLLGALLTGIYTFRMLFVVFLGKPSAFVREHLHLHNGHEGPFSMTTPVAALALLAAVGGLIQVAGAWHLFGDFLEPAGAVARDEYDLVHPSTLQDWLTSLFAVLLGGAGIFVAWTLYGVRRRPVPRMPAAQHALEHKLYFDEAYDVMFYRPADAIARAFIRFVERPLIEGSIAGLAGATRLVGARVGLAQTGFLRTYALAIAGGVAVLALVFVSVRL
jgi:NADH-quinone oxidoreductase subunit L